MKKITFLPVLFLLGLLAALSVGCHKTETTPGTPPKAAGNIPAGAVPVVSAEKTSFNEVTSQLDLGGNLYLYLGTAQWLDGLSTKVAGWQQTFENMPQIKDADRANVDKAFGMVTRLIKDSGIEDVTGVGMSSVEIEKGFYRNKLFLHHYPGKNQGFLWKMMGEAPHPLSGLDLLPTDTALASFSDVDVPLFWSVVKDETSQSGFPQASELLEKLPTQFEQQTQVKWDDFLKSLGGEFGFALTLNESNNVEIPLPSGPLQVAEPGLVIVIKVNDDTIFNRIDQELKENPQVISVNKADLKMRTMPIPLPLPINLRPTAASSGGYLLIATSDTLIDEVLAVKNGQKPGLKSMEEFKRLSKDIPDQGNHFTFMSAEFGRTLLQIQTQALGAAGGNSSSAVQAQWIQSLMTKNQLAFAYTVGVNTESGYLMVGNGSQSAAKLALVPAVAVPGLLAAIAIPNFVKARATSQNNLCINNLRQIDGAKQQWALENHKTSSDTPTKADLLPYLRRWPVCPQGGTYNIGSMVETPTCSIPGHKLP